MDLTDPKTAILVAAGILLLAMVASAFGFMRRRLNLRRRSYQEATAAKLAELNGLLDQILAGDLEVYRRVLDANNGNDPWYIFVRNRCDRKLSERYEAALTHGAQLSNYETVLAKARELLADYRGSAASDAKIVCLVHLFGALREATHGNANRVCLELGHTNDELLELLDRAIAARFEELLATARGTMSGEGDRNPAAAFLLLCALIDDTRFSNDYHHPGQFSRVSVIKLARPDDWNELLVRHVENPGITLFKRDDQRLSPGDLLHLAANAEASGRLVDMLLALAYHNAARGASELTDELVTSLIRKVVALRASAMQVTEN